MRYWEFGLFDGQAADIDFDDIGSCRSILALDQNTSNQEGFKTHNPEQTQSGSDGGTNPTQNLVFVNIALDQLKAELGQIPILLSVQWNLMAAATQGSTNNSERIWTMYTPWEVNDVTNRYSDVSAAITWYGDAYAPFPGQDRSLVPYYTADPGGQVADTRYTFDVTDIVALALRDNEDVRFMMWAQDLGSGGDPYYYWVKPTVISKRPKLDFYYMYPIEFYESSGGSIDLSSNVEESENGYYYLGAVERGATSTPVQGWVRNYTDETKQVELFDDHPEWITPVQRVGTGTGLLDYVTLAENATSQLYTVVFYSSTQYEVKAEAYRDNSTSYHPQIDADGSWRSDTSSNFTSPSGGLTIPAAAWQKENISSGDEFEVGVRGNTTDSSWPADSNDQVEITYDNSGSPDTGSWRPVIGHRERTTAGVTISGASVFFPIRHMDSTVWSIGDPCFIHDQDNIDEGTLASVQERALDSVTFTGTGLNDATSSGNYNGNSNKTFRVQIDGTGTPDTFSWSNDGTTSWEATGVSITGAAQLLEDGVWITFGATTGHTSGDYWTFDADCWALWIGSLSVTSHAYNPGAVVAQTLPIRDLGAAEYSTLSAASGASQSPSSRIYLNDTSPFTQGDTIFIQQTASGGAYETAVIATGGVTSTYIDLTTSLVEDYDPGDFCTVSTSGQDAFWMRIVATTTTVEQLKRLRINARIL